MGLQITYEVPVECAGQSKIRTAQSEFVVGFYNAFEWFNGNYLFDSEHRLGGNGVCSIVN